MIHPRFHSPPLLLPATLRRRLRPHEASAESAHLQAVLEGRVLGQTEPLRRIVRSFSRLQSGLRDPARPALTVLLLGPTGVGKTETARALAEALFGDSRSLLRIDCEEYAHGHEVAKLLGSPPGYVGYNIEPLLSQQRVDKAHRDALEAKRGLLGTGEARLENGIEPEAGRYASLLLFDEIEKAHPILWNALLALLDDGTITLGNNQSVDLTRSIVLMTSNVGGNELGDLLQPVRLGFHHTDSAPGPRGVVAAASDAARRIFPPEFLNRFDETLYYQPLGRHTLSAILDKLLHDVHRRALESGTPFLARPSARAHAWLLEQGTDPRFGARPLRRTVESEVVDPLSNLIVSGELQAGDIVEIELEDGALAFYRRARNQPEEVSELAVA